LIKSLFIFGSCVSRDAFGQHNGGLYRLETYVARSSLGSALGRVPMQGINLEKIESPFQRRMVEIDTSKSLEALLLASKADIILIDMIDERFDLFQSPSGAVCTVSNELRSSGFQPDPVTGTVIKSGSEAFYLMWEQGWQAFIAILKKKSLLPRLRINQIFWSPTHEDGSPFRVGYLPADILRANQFLQRLYQRMERDLDASHFISFPKELMLASLNHRWGSSPFHFVDKFYLHMTNNLHFPQTSAMQTNLQPNFSARPASGQPHSPDLLLHVNNTALTAETIWYEISAPQGANLQFCFILRCADNISNHRALISIECCNQHGERIVVDGFSISHNPAVGHYKYLSTGPGESKSTFMIMLPIGFKTLHVGVRDWWPESPIMLEQLSIRMVPKNAQRSLYKTLISVDVEALPGRASQNPVDRLIFGDFGDGKRNGIERLCDLFERFKIRATFFVDYAGCAIHGDEGIFRAARLLRERGHDVQLHMHCEILVRQKRWPQHIPTFMPTFQNLDLNVMQACLEFGVEKFEKSLGYRPRIFRPGGLYHSRKMVQAVKNVGMEAVSSLYRGRPGLLWPEFGDQAIFQWDNGIKEMPLDFGLDPLSGWSPTQNTILNALNERPAHRTVGLLLHSNSLLLRDQTANPSCFTGFHQPYEDQLIEYLTWLSANTGFATYSELLDQAQPLKTIELERYYPGEEITFAVMPQVRHDQAATTLAPVPVSPPAVPAKPSVVPGDAAPSSPGLTLELPPYQALCPVQRLVQLVPPAQLPLKLAPGQRIDAIALPLEPHNDLDGMAYILTGHKVYIQRQRATIPGEGVLNACIAALFKRHPGVELIIIESALETTPVTEYSSKEEVRRTFVLELPDRFERYRAEFISKKHRSDMERKERTVPEILPGLQFQIVSGAELDLATFTRAAELIESRLQQKAEETHNPAAAIFRAADAQADWDTYSRHGAVAHFSGAGTMYAAALVLIFNHDCYFMISGHSDLAPRHSLGNLLLYRLIEALIGKGIQRLHLGGGDFGYKSRFGAIEQPLFTFQFKRPANDPWRTRVLDAIACGQSPALLEQDMGRSMEDLLGEHFEQDLKVDFNTIVELQDLGSDIRNRRYQATMKEAFITLMKAVPRTADDVFVDVGCGKGKMLYYAAQLGYAKCIGLELSALLVECAQANLQRMQLLSHVTLMQRNACFLDPNELAQANIFYLYCPFTEEIMADFVRALVESQKIRPRTLYIVYCNAQFQVSLRQNGFQVFKEFNKGSPDWRFDNSVILSREPQ
jgi:16S rRNA G966 N2-methylase RsmD/peptidoglycan/xylan/chitin deacetylase (PgdA/CDA1 family)